jgi:hypothetical protein
MAEPAYPRAEIIIKAIAPVLTLVGILVGIHQFQEEQRETTRREYALIAKQDSVEFKRRVWQEQLDIYRRLVGTTGLIASSTDDRVRLDSAVREFNSLYWGLVGFVGDSLVEQHMNDFRVQIYDFRRGMSSPEDLKVRADMLNQAARRSLQKNWQQVSQAR